MMARILPLQISWAAKMSLVRHTLYGVVVSELAIFIPLSMIVTFRSNQD